MAQFVTITRRSPGTMPVWLAYAAPLHAHTAGSTGGTIDEAAQVDPARMGAVGVGPRLPRWHCAVRGCGPAGHRTAGRCLDLCDLHGVRLGVFDRRRAHRGTAARESDRLAAAGVRRRLRACGPDQRL